MHTILVGIKRPKSYTTQPDLFLIVGGLIITKNLDARKTKSEVNKQPSFGLG